MNDLPVRVNNTTQERKPSPWLGLAVLLLLPIAIPINILLWQAVVGVR